MNKYARRLQFLKKTVENGNKKNEIVDFFIHEGQIEVNKNNHILKFEPFEELPTIPALLRHMIDFITKMGYVKIIDTMPETRLFKVEIKEVLQATIEIEAESAEQAEEIVQKSWKNGAYKLDENNLIDVEIEAIESEQKIPNK